MSDELLLILEKIDRHWNGKSISAEWRPLFGGISMAQDMYLAVKQHYEQKRLDRPDMTKEEANEVVKGAFGSRPDFPSGKDYVDKVRGHIPDRPELKEKLYHILPTYARKVDEIAEEGLIHSETRAKWGVLLEQTLDQILALIPDTEQIDAMLVEARRIAKKQERGRIIAFLKGKGIRANVIKAIENDRMILIDLSDIDTHVKGRGI